MTAIKTYEHQGTGVIREYPASVARNYPDLIEVQAAVSGCRDCGPAVPVVIDDAPDTADDAVIGEPKTAAKAAKTKE